MFELPFRFCFDAHGLCTNLIALCLDLAAPTRQLAVFVHIIFLVNRHSDFRALGFLTGVDILGDIVLLPVSTSGV